MRVRAGDLYIDDRRGAARRPRHDGMLSIMFAIVMAFVIAAIVALSLEPSGLQVAAVGNAPASSAADPCESQTWPHFTATCIASKSGRRSDVRTSR